MSNLHLQVVTFDETKRLFHLEKHGLDFEDAVVVFDSQDKVTFESNRHGEKRNMDWALIEVFGTLLALVYVKRSEEIKVIAFRRTSRCQEED